MRLETADRDYDSIDDYTINEAVRAVADLKTNFATLTLDDRSFMQVAGGTAGLVLEYQDGQTDCHFRAADESLSAEDVIAAFESFASGDFAYREAADWQPLEETNVSGCGTAVLFAVALPALTYMLS
jgi:hypothetical protein